MSRFGKFTLRANQFNLLIMAGLFLMRVGIWLLGKHAEEVLRIIAGGTLLDLQKQGLRMELIEYAPHHIAMNICRIDEPTSPGATLIQ